MANSQWRIAKEISPKGKWSKKKVQRETSNGKLAKANFHWETTKGRTPGEKSRKMTVGKFQKYNKKMLKGEFQQENPKTTKNMGDFPWGNSPLGTFQRDMSKGQKIVTRTRKQACSVVSRRHESKLTNDFDFHTSNTKKQRAKQKAQFSPSQKDPGTLTALRNTSAEPSRAHPPSHLRTSRTATACVPWAHGHGLFKIR